MRCVALRCVALCCVASYGVVLCCAACSLLQIDSHSLTDLKLALCALVDALPAGAAEPTAQCGTPCHTLKPLTSAQPTKRTLNRRCAVESPEGIPIAEVNIGRSAARVHTWRRTVRAGRRSMPVRACAQTRTSRSSRSRTSWRSTTSRQRTSPRATYSAYARAVPICTRTQGWVGPGIRVHVSAGRRRM